MIIPSFNLTATDRVLPKLALDFTTATLDPRVTFTRTTSATNPATYVNNSGYVTTATNNQPRFDYDPTTLVCKGLLIEESRSNVITYSEDFENAAWEKFRGSVTTNQITAPDNSSNADKFIEDTTNNTHILRNPNFTFVSGTTYTYSVYVKSNGRSIAFRMAGVAASEVGFNLSTGTIQFNNNANLGVRIENAGNGWYRCSVTYAYTTGGTITMDALVTGTNSTVYVGDGSSGYYIWGAQLEVGAFPTSYIPNLTTGTKTRNADVATMTGTNFSSWYNASEGTLKVTADTLSVAANSKTPTLASLYTDSSNLMRFWIWDGAPTSVRWTGLNALVTQFDLSNAPITANSNFSVVGAYKLNNFAQSINASVPSVDTSGTVPSITAFNIGSISGGSTQFWNGHIAKILYWPQKLINAEVQSFSI